MNMKHTAKWAALWSMAVLGGTETLVHRASAASDTRPASSARASEGSSERAQAARHPRVSRKDGAAHHVRRRQGSDAEGAGAPAPGEVVGGVDPSHRRPLGKPGRQAHGETKDTASHRRVARVVPKATKAPCLHEPIQFERGFGGELQPVVLTRCDGRAAEHAIEQVSVLVRPMNAPRPTGLTTPVRSMAGEREWLPGVKLIHEGLVGRLQQVVDHFQAKKVTVVSGYRPASLGSFHQSARALDFHIEGVGNEALVAFCRTIPDTGCGYYPNSSFVHMDVRSPKTGHVYWIDASGPGEPARYVASWPLRDSVGNDIPRPDPAAPLDEHTHPDSSPLSPGASDTKIDARTIAPLSAGDGKDDPFAP